jgi:hypothetical protein
MLCTGEAGTRDFGTLLNNRKLHGTRAVGGQRDGLPWLRAASGVAVTVT